MSSWNPGVSAPKNNPAAAGAEPAAGPKATVSGAWRTGLAGGSSDAAAAALSGSDAKKRLGELLGVRRGAKKSAKPAKKPAQASALAGAGSALGPVADGAYSLACFSGTAAQAIKALDDGAQAWPELSPQKRSPELFAISRGESMAPALQAAGAPPQAWLAANSGQALELACSSKSLTILKMLLASGAQADAPGSQGKTALEAALSRRWDPGVLALLSAGARLEPAEGPESATAPDLLAAWKNKLGRALGVEAQLLTAEFERRALLGASGLADSFAQSRQGLWSYAQPEFQAARETAMGDGTDSLLPGVDWSHAPEPGEMARRLRYAREREKEASKPKRAAKRM